MMVLMPRTLTRPKPLESATTPGVVNASADQRRLLTGISCKARVFRFEEKSGDSKFRIGAVDITSTTSLVAPVVMCGSSVVS